MFGYKETVLPRGCRTRRRFPNRQTVLFLFANIRGRRRERYRQKNTTRSRFPRNRTRRPAINPGKTFSNFILFSFHAVGDHLDQFVFRFDFKFRAILPADEKTVFHLVFSLQRGNSKNNAVGGTPGRPPRLFRLDQNFNVPTFTRRRSLVRILRRPLFKSLS